MRLAAETELKNANDRYTYMVDIEKCMHKLEERGFVDRYKVRDGQLWCIDSATAFSPGDVKAVNFYRFESISNPDDMAILQAIETVDGRKVTLVNAYGFYADDEIEHIMMDVETHKSVRC